MTNVKSFLIHLLYRLFLSLEKIKNINLEFNGKNITETENKLIETFCLSVEPPIIKLFHSILTINNTNEIKIYMSIQKWLKLTESNEYLFDQPSGHAGPNNPKGLFDQPSGHAGPNNPKGLFDQHDAYFLVECIDNIIKDANKLQLKIDSYIYKFIYSKSIIPNLIIIMEKLCCLLDGYESCSKYSDIIHDELLPLLQYWCKHLL